MSMSVEETYISVPAQNPTGFQLLATASLGGAAATLSTGTFAARKTLQVLIACEGKSAAEVLGLRCNADATNMYSWRYSQNGAADTTATSQSYANIDATSGGTFRTHVFIILDNTLGQNKRIEGFSSYAGNAAAASSHCRFTDVWQPGGGEQVTALSLLSSGGGNLNAGTKIDVYGAN